MRTAVIYYSLEGNMDYVAQKIGENGTTDLYRLIPKKEYPKGKVSKYVWGGKSATFGERPALVDPKISLDQYDTLVIGTPIWAATMTPPIHTFLHDSKIEGKRIILVATCAGEGNEKAFAKMKEYLTGNTVVGTFSFVNPLQRQNEDFHQKIERIQSLMTEQ